MIAVPPALPAAMSCGIVFAIQRLKNQKIFCISPPRVNLAGRVTTFVFDKTGTLTEDGLSVHGVRPVTDEASFSEFRPDAKDLLPTNDNRKRHFMEALANCTSITYVDGKLIGDPLDVEMFKATGWRLIEPHSSEAIGQQALAITKPKDGSLAISLLKRFDFSSALQRMTVLCQN